MLDSYYDRDIDHYRLIIDAKRMLIVGLERYKHDKILHRIRWLNIKTNIQINNDKFDL